MESLPEAKRSLLWRTSFRKSSLHSANLACTEFWDISSELIDDCIEEGLEREAVESGRRGPDMGSEPDGLRGRSGGSNDAW